MKPGKVPPRNLATFDHVVPRGLGGAFAPSSNGVMACLSCNNRRQTMPVEEFRALIAAEQAR
ncbi:HNH endonuclease [Sphingopyxis sp. J-6]|uniref:HNH endonuclease n=1 Tax=Sphingopyxis sp. J-6 TaxID=3122054 RepID=UPI0039843929